MFGSYKRGERITTHDGRSGTVTHLDGDQDETGRYSNAGSGDSEVWVEFDDDGGEWVETQSIAEPRKRFLGLF